jgi:sarcosine oxidase subunit alpha
LEQGGRIDRSRTLRFTFDGRDYAGHPGDTLASALLANDVGVVARSFKYHRPRGVLSAGVEEPNALVTLGEGGRLEPNVRATLVPLADRLSARSQNAWPSLAFDVGRLADAAHALLPPGFYHKTFKWPSWHAYEGAIRRSAGLGPAPTEADPDRYDVQNASCDVLVVGGGPAGLVAALAAAESGARVLLLEQDAELGGSLLAERGSATAELVAWVANAQARLVAMDGVRVLAHTTCSGLYDHGVATAVERMSEEYGGAGPVLRQRYWRMRAAQIVLATGAIEQPAVFPYNDLPGVMLAGSVRHYLNRCAVTCGRKVAVVTNDDTAYQTALDLADAGIEVVAVVDSRAAAEGTWPREVRKRGLRLYAESAIGRAHGGSRVRHLSVTSANGAKTWLDCDAVAMSSGWQPTLHLYCHAGGKLAFDERQQCFVPREGPAYVRVVGAAAGLWSGPRAIEQALATGLAAARASGHRATAAIELPRLADVQLAPTQDRRQIPSRRSDRCWIDFQHDVTARDVEIAVRENYVSVEHLKRYTTNGMSIDQGKTSNLNALAILARLTDRETAATGTTTFRPPYAPVTLATIAARRTGRLYRPIRDLPTHDLQIELGASFEEFGGWQRPASYPRAGESLEVSSAREVRAVRSGVGIFEGSPLGKILVRGPDAADFLDRIYANTMSTLAIGQARYGLMLNEKGVIIDDGVCARLGEREYWVSTTSGGATRIARWLDEWLQCEWPGLRIVATPITEHWATIAVAGPKARAVLSTLTTDIDLSASAFAHLQVRTGQLANHPCVMMRVSFTGELSYEINVPADSAGALWLTLLAAGGPHGITPFGIEALMTMRIEKGFLHVGSDTDGTTVPDDVGFGAAVARKRVDFIGRRSLTLPENQRTDRMQLVALRAVDPGRPLVAGAHLVDTGTAGYVTSACESPSLGESIGLGLLRRGRARYGERVRVFDNGAEWHAEVVAPGLYDSKGERLHA